MKMEEVTLTEKEVINMVTNLKEAEAKLITGIKHRSALLETIFQDLPEVSILRPTVVTEIKVLRRALIGIQNALLNLEVWLFSAK